MKAITDGGLSYNSYKVIIAVKSLHNFINPRVDDPHRFKEEVKVKYNATVAIVEKFPNRTAFLEQLLATDTPSETLDDYCVLGSNDRLVGKRKQTI